jgi:hypothetical protein
MDIGTLADVAGKWLTKSPGGRPANIGHFHDDEGPAHFLELIFQPVMTCEQFLRYLVSWSGMIHSKINLVTNTWCGWVVKTKFDDDKAIIDQEWTAFAIAHDLKVSCVLKFHKEAASNIFRVISFDNSYCEVLAPTMKTTIGGPWKRNSYR